MSEQIRPNSVFLHAATAEDIPIVEAIRNQVKRSAYPNIAPDYVTEADYDAQEAAFKEIGLERGMQSVNDPTKHIMLANVQAEAAGICISRINDDDSREVLSLYVREEFQGNGVGSTLLKDALQWLRADEHPVILEVIAMNQHAIALYERNGFAYNRDIPPYEPEPPMKYIPHIEMIRKPASIV